MKISYSLGLLLTFAASYVCLTFSIALYRHLLTALSILFSGCVLLQMRFREGGVGA